MNSNTKSILGFSNSDETHREFNSKSNSNAINPFDSLSIKPLPTSEFMTETQINAPPPPPPHQIQETNSFAELKLQHLRILPKPGGGGGGGGIGVMAELENADEQDEGCRTPTSIQHKIPLIQQCPYAPKKPKSIPCRKRRSTTSSNSNSMRFVRRRIDFYDCLSPLVQTHLEDLGCRIKKIRATPPTSPYKI